MKATRPPLAGCARWLLAAASLGCDRRPPSPPTPRPDAGVRALDAAADAPQRAPPPDDAARPLDAHAPAPALDAAADAAAPRAARPGVCPDPVVRRACEQLERSNRGRLRAAERGDAVDLLVEPACLCGEHDAWALELDHLSLGADESRAGWQLAYIARDGRRITSGGFGGSVSRGAGPGPGAYVKIDFVQDFEGDGVSEVALEYFSFTGESVARESPSGVLTIEGDAIVPATRGAAPRYADAVGTPDAFRDLDGDGRLDLVGSFDALEQSCAGLQVTGGPLLGLRIPALLRPDGTLSEDGPLVRAFLRAQCTDPDVPPTLLNHKDDSQPFQLARQDYVSLLCAAFCGTPRAALEDRVRAFYAAGRRFGDPGDNVTEVTQCVRFDELFRAASFVPPFTAPELCSEARGREPRGSPSGRAPARPP